MSSRLKIFIIFTSLFLMFPTASHANWRDNLPDGMRLNGRYFWAAGYSWGSPFLDDSPFGELNFRLNGRYTINPNWKLEFAYQVDGTYLESISLVSGSASEGILDLNWPIDSSDNWMATHSLDRFNFKYRGDGFTLDIGRQRIAWGTTMIMSFMDMFHPISPGDPFVPEQPGTDGIRLQVETGPVSGWDVLYAWLDGDGSEAFAARYHFVEGAFETGISAGSINGNGFAAYETSGDINDIGVRVESAWRDSETGNPWQLALESDYAPNDHTYLSGEIFYNGPGATEFEQYDVESIIGGELYSARWYGGFSGSYNTGGLETYGLFGIFNLTDGSWFADLSMSRSMSDSSDLRVGYQHFSGKTLTEYGALPDMLYVISTRYF